MNFRTVLAAASLAASLGFASHGEHQSGGDRNVSMALFSDLEELSRIVDISYCTGLIATGLSKPFHCWCRCGDFPHFELVKGWRTGISMQSDSGGYVALDHHKQRILVAFRGTINMAGWLANFGLSPQEYTPFPGAEDQVSGEVETGKTAKAKGHVSSCADCTVHTGFYKAWNNTRPHVLEAVREHIEQYPQYELHLVGHSLGAAVAAFAALDFSARGWEPVITTFGEPRIGNVATNRHIDEVFGLNQDPQNYDDHDQSGLRWRRITHTKDPIPLVPPTEWGYGMHAGEIHITKPSLSPSVYNLKHCHGAFHEECIAGQDPTYPEKLGTAMLERKSIWVALAQAIPQLLISIVKWEVPHRYRLWQMFISHRDYFWRLGLCVPGGDPTGGGGDFPELEQWRAERGIMSGQGPLVEVAREVEKEL
ncbi:hypothetical protein D0867_03823 [Hortaea werneckii]|uniref:Fungal lipase-type domain-containing protein n=1 Tax=Hortaea werneckii TaxID=91943 RepID=A0A3M7A035_HORWE|nr:extracellular lipase [Hortaea werneckii]RMY20709.1 hypothetical protein D0867_03823 [Hortaea werneckii]RMY30489.1 hypothetical protein D0866_07966 [Hortaea werneckii]